MTYPPWGDILHLMYRPKDTKESILHRLKIASGHLNKVIEMVDKDHYCIDVIHQSQAVQSALSQADDLLLENHLKTCAAEAIAKGKREEAIAEVLEVFRKAR